MTIIKIQIYSGPIIRAQGRGIPSEGQIIFKPSQTWILKNSLNNEELILCQVQPGQGMRGTQDQLENCGGLGPGKIIINFNLPAFGVGHKEFTLQEGLWFLFHSMEICCKQICQLHKLALCDLSQLSQDWCMTPTNNESLLRFGHWSRIIEAGQATGYTGAGEWRGHEGHEAGRAWVCDGWHGREGRNNSWQSKRTWQHPRSHRQNIGITRTTVNLEELDGATPTEAPGRKILVGRVLLRIWTTASTIELMDKGATEPEGAVGTTISLGDNRGKSSELSPVDKLLLVEWGGFFHDVQSNKSSDKWDEQKIRQQARKQWSTNGEILFSQLRSATQGQPYNYAIWAASTLLGQVEEKGIRTTTWWWRREGMEMPRLMIEERQSVLSGTETQLANEAIRKRWERLNYYSSTDNARLT